MALGPKHMGDAILKNLEAKTGQSLEAWLEVVAASNLFEKKAILSHLKEEHGLGHFQAQKVYEASQSIDLYAGDQDFAKALFNTPDLAAAFVEVRQFILALGADVTERPCKTYIPFYAKRQFVMVTSRKTGILLGFALAENEGDKHPELVPATSLGSDRINYKLQLSASTGLTRKAESLIRTAYQQNQ